MSNFLKAWMIMSNYTLHTKTNLVTSVILHLIHSLLLTHNLFVAWRLGCTFDCCTDRRTLISRVVQGTHALDTCEQAVLRVIQRRLYTNCICSLQFITLFVAIQKPLPCHPLLFQVFARPYKIAFLYTWETHVTPGVFRHFKFLRFSLVLFHSRIVQRLIVTVPLWLAVAAADTAVGWLNVGVDGVLYWLEYWLPAWYVELGVVVVWKFPAWV